jgi:hypothetical protein
MNCILLMILGILTLCFHCAFAQGVYERPAVVATVDCNATYHVGQPVLANCTVTSHAASAYQQVCWTVYYPVDCQVDIANPNAWMRWPTPTRLCASLPSVGQSTSGRYNLDKPQPRCRMILKDGATFSLTADGLGLYNQRAAIPMVSSIPLKRGGSMSISQSDLDSLKKWVGKYPMQLGTSKGVRPEEQLPSKNLFELPYIRQGLINLPDNDFKKITAEVDWNIVPIELVSNHLVIRRCRAHSCGSEEAILVVSLYDGSMHVSFWNEEEETSRKIRWFSTKGNYKDLPKEILDSWYRWE